MNDSKYAAPMTIIKGNLIYIGDIVGIKTSVMTSYGKVISFLKQVATLCTVECMLVIVVKCTTLMLGLHTNIICQNNSNITL